MPQGQSIVKPGWKPEGVTARCKFCGGEGIPLPPLLLRQPGGNKSQKLWAMGCPLCGVHTVHGQTHEEAVAHWNEQLYSENVYVLMGESKPLDDDGAERLLTAIMKDLAREYVRSRSMAAMGEKDMLSIAWLTGAKECRQSISDWCDASGLNYAGVMRGLDQQVEECVLKCRKAWTKAVKRYLHISGREVTDEPQDDFDGDRGE